MIFYREGYKYQLAKDYAITVPILINKTIRSEFFELTETGELTIRKDYAWDGPSGPAFDTKNFMRGSLVHDALYQMMRERGLSQDHRQTADEILREICIEDGMSRIRAWWVYQGVHLGAAKAASPYPDDWNPTITAP